MSKDPKFVIGSPPQYTGDSLTRFVQARRAKKESRSPLPDTDTAERPGGAMASSSLNEHPTHQGSAQHLPRPYLSSEAAMHHLSQRAGDSSDATEVDPGRFSHNQSGDHAQPIPIPARPGLQRGYSDYSDPRYRRVSPSDQSDLSDHPRAVLPQAHLGEDSQLQFHYGNRAGAADLPHTQSIHPQNRLHNFLDEQITNPPMIFEESGHAEDYYHPWGRINRQRKQVFENLQDRRAQAEKQHQERKERDAQNRAANLEHRRNDSEITTLTPFVQNSQAAARENLKSAAPVRPKPGGKYRPARINIVKAEEYHKDQQHKQHKDVQAVRGTRLDRDDTSSVYSERELPETAMISPLRVPRVSSMQRYGERREEAGKDEIIDSYANRDDQEKTAQGEATSRSKSMAGRHEKPSEQSMPKEDFGIKKSTTMADIDTKKQTAPFTPLTGWLNREENVKLGGKQLLGPVGFLENQFIESRKKPEPPKVGLLVSIKKKARELVGAPFAQQTVTHPRVVVRVAAISLNPRTQCIVYAEVEFVLNKSVNAYIKRQMDRARLDPKKHKRVADSWASQGRPRVVGFQYDLETQIDLVISHARQGEFEFDIPPGTPLGVVLGCLQACKVNARQMRYRTYCYNDTIIGKHIADGQRLLQYIGAHDDDLATLNNCAALHSRCVELGEDKNREDDQSYETRGRTGYSEAHDQHHGRGKSQDHDSGAPSNQGHSAPQNPSYGEPVDNAFGGYHDHVYDRAQDHVYDRAQDNSHSVAPSQSYGGYQDNDRGNSQDNSHSMMQSQSQVGAQNQSHLGAQNQGDAGTQNSTAFSLGQPTIPPYDESLYSGTILQPTFYRLPVGRNPYALRDSDEDDH